MMGVPAHQAHFWEDVECLASPCLGAADHPALRHSWVGVGVLLQMLPPMQLLPPQLAKPGPSSPHL